MEIKLDSIKAFFALTAFHIIMSTVIPGFLFLYRYKPIFFETTDLFRLIVISLSITVPVLIFNGTIVLFFLATQTHKSEDIDEKSFNKRFGASMYFGSFLSIIVLYVPMILDYFYNFALPGVIKGMLIIQTILVVSVILNDIIISIRRKKKRI
jgi:hypothetical protein